MIYRISLEQILLQSFLFLWKIDDFLYLLSCEFRVKSGTTTLVLLWFKMNLGPSTHSGSTVTAHTASQYVIQNYCSDASKNQNSITLKSAHRILVHSELIWNLFTKTFYLSIPSLKSQNCLVETLIPIKSFVIIY